MRKIFIILGLIFLVPTRVLSAELPSDIDINKTIKICAVGISKEVQLSVSSRVKHWFTLEAEGKASYGELGAILNPKDRSISSENYKNYTSCIMDMISKFYGEKNITSCNNPIYKIDRGLVCGIEKYKSSSSVNCGVLEYNTNSGAQCGVDQYVYCETGACGWNSCGFVKKCDAKECRHSNCGVERYKTCQHKDFGVKTYKTCRHEDNGVETYKACRNEEFGFERCAD